MLRVLQQVGNGKICLSVVWSRLDIVEANLSKRKWSRIFPFKITLNESVFGVRLCMYVCD